MSDRGFSPLPHTADAGFEAWAPALTALYAEAALALFGLIGEPSSIEPVEAFRVTSRGVDREDLLVRLLADLLAGFEIEGLFVTAATGVETRRTPEGDLEAVLSCEGGRVDRDHEPGLVEVKAITYHGLSVREEDGVFRATVYVDL